MWVQKELDEIAKELSDLITVRRMFDTEGWTIYARQLTQELVDAENALIEGTFSGENTEWKIRGKASYLRKLLRKPEELDQDILRKQEQLETEPG